MRYDIFKGPFTQNDQLSASSYPDGFCYIPGVNFDLANAVTNKLNNKKGLKLQERGDVDPRYPTWREMTSSPSVGHQEVLADYKTPGYVTNDVSKFLFFTLR